MIGKALWTRSALGDQADFDIGFDHWVRSEWDKIGLACRKLSFPYQRECTKLACCTLSKAMENGKEDIWRIC